MSVLLTNTSVQIRQKRMKTNDVVCEAPSFIFVLHIVSLLTVPTFLCKLVPSKVFKIYSFGILSKTQKRLRKVFPNRNCAKNDTSICRAYRFFTGKIRCHFTGEKRRGSGGQVGKS